MKRILVTLAALSLAACGRPVDEFRNALPGSDTVKLDVPSHAGQALTGEPQKTQQGLQGQTADFYKLTVGMTVVVNGSTLLVLGLVKAITDQEPTTLTTAEAVWGPYTEPLSPTTWKLTVKSEGNQRYTYALEGKAKTAEDSAYVTVLSGSHQRTSLRHGSGTFLVDWDAAKTLPGNDGSAGSAVFTYSKTDAAAKGTIEVDFSKVLDRTSNKTLDAKYRYEATPGSGGAFAFSAQSNVGAGALAEELVINSRWKETGAGRSDVKVSGGDIGAGATASECWDATFSSRYLSISFSPASNYGTEATDCAFQTAVFASL